MWFKDGIKYYVKRMESGKWSYGVKRPYKYFVSDVKLLKEEVERRLREDINLTFNQLTNNYAS